MNEGSHDLDDLARRFEAVSRNADSVELRQFVEDHGFGGDHPQRVPALYRLIPIDMAYRWQRGEVNSLDGYLDDFTELGPADRLSEDLILKEYQVRQQHGDKPDLGTYRLRFPQQFPELQRLVRAAEADSPGPDRTRAAVPADRPRSPPTARASPPSAPDRPASVPDRPASAVMSGMSGAIVPIGEGFQLIKRIGSGGFGEVWLAEAPGGVPSAVKIIFRSMDHEDAKREKEALEVIKTLRHRCLIQTTSFFQKDDRLFISMELADGNLRDRLKEVRQQGLPTIPLEELITYFRDAAEGLDYLHSKHVQHRDIKPDNIMLLGGHAKLADFGLARVLEQSMHTATGSGTPPYMAPEIWMGKVSEHSDQYALACAYAELRLNRRIFQSTQLREMMLDHLERTPDLSGLPEAEQKVILKALAKEPGQRYPSCKELMRELVRAVTPLLPADVAEGAVDGAWETAPPDARTHRIGPGGPGAAGSVQVTIPVPEPSLSRRAFVLAGIGLPLAGIGGFLGWWLTRDNTETSRTFLPPRCEPDVDAKLVDVAERNLQAYTRIAYVIDDQTKIPFILIPHEQDGDPEPFYIMEDKVWNALFKRFISDDKATQTLLEYEEKRSWTVQRLWTKGGVKDYDRNKEKGTDLGVDNRHEYPVLRVTVTEAFCFAKWLGGHLPTVFQWDKAAGKTGDRPGPYQGTTKPVKYEVAINLADEGPMAVGKASRDRSVHGCRDMSGNGYEWLRDMKAQMSERFAPIPVSELPETKPRFGDYMVQVRGMPYDQPEAFTFNEGGELMPYEKADPFISFRVVIEFPVR